jgi:hypothetical protein
MSATAIVALGAAAHATVVAIDALVFLLSPSCPGVPRTKPARRVAHDRVAKTMSNSPLDAG